MHYLRPAMNITDLLILGKIAYQNNLNSDFLFIDNFFKEVYGKNSLLLLQGSNTAKRRCRMKLNKQSLWIIVIFVAMAVIIPIVIQVVFVPDYKQALIAAKWSAGEFLGYCGAILGALSTIVAIILTINFTVENQKIERKLAIKPYLHSDHHPIYNLKEIPENNIMYVIIGNDYMCSVDKPHVLIKACEKTDPFSEVTNLILFRTHHHLLKYELSNVGAGNAINVSIIINNRPFNTPVALPLSTTLKFIFMLKDEILIDDQKMMEIVITYSDIASIASYEQKEIIKFFRDSQDSLLTTSQKNEWLLSNPVEK